MPLSCRFEFTRDPAESGGRLRGCGLLVINPPYILADEAQPLLPYLAQVLSPDGEPPFRPLIAERPAT